jgi:hypothetical protein
MLGLGGFMGIAAACQREVEFGVGLRAGQILEVLRGMNMGVSAAEAGRIVRGTTGLNLWSWGETITMTRLSETRWKIRSECSMPLQLVDWGQNRRNVERVEKALRAALGVESAV